MAYPPSDVEPSWLFQALMERPSPSEVVPYPSEALDRDGNQIMIRVMGMRTDELEPKTVAAKRWVQSRYKMTDIELESDLGRERITQRTAQEILADGIRYADPIPGSENTPSGVDYPYVFYKQADKVATLPPRDVHVLFALWNLVQNRIAPNESSFETAEEIEAWVRVLTEGARPFGFFRLDLPQQEDLLTRLLSLARSSLELLSSPPESWHTSLESLRSDWGIGTGSFTPRAVEPTQSSSPEAVDPEAMTAEEAKARAEAMLDMARKIDL